MGDLKDEGYGSGGSGGLMHAQTHGIGGGVGWRARNIAPGQDFCIYIGTMRNAYINRVWLTSAGSYRSWMADFGHQNLLAHADDRG